MDNPKRVKAVYTVVPKPEGKDVWLRVGSAFPNRDGSLTVLLDAIPTNGRLQVRELPPRDLEAGAAAAPRDVDPGTSAAPREVAV